MIMSVLSLPHVNYSSASPPQAPQTVPGWNVTNETNVGASESALPAWTPLGPLALTLVSCSWRSFYWSQVFIPTNGISPKIVNKLWTRQHTITLHYTALRAHWTFYIKLNYQSLKTLWDWWSLSALFNVTSTRLTWRWKIQKLSQHPMSGQRLPVVLGKETQQIIHGNITRRGMTDNTDLQGWLPTLITYIAVCRVLRVNTCYMLRQY